MTREKLLCIIQTYKTKQHNKKEIHQFVVLNHILFSNIAAFTSGRERKTPYHDEVKRLLRRTLKALTAVSQKLNPTYQPPTIDLALPEKSEKGDMGTDDNLIKGQLEFILRLTNDLDRITERFVAG